MKEKKKGPQGSTVWRHAHAAESFRTAAEAIGPIMRGMRLFLISRGQWSMIDAILHVIDELTTRGGREDSPSRVDISVWTWTIAEYDVEVLGRLMIDDRIRDALLIVNRVAKDKNAHIIDRWRDIFGPKSVKYATTHAKIARVEELLSDGQQEPRRRVLIRGSMNLNHNPRYEQCDISEGGPEYDLVRRVEDEHPYLTATAPAEDFYAAARLGESITADQLELCRDIRTWRPVRSRRDDK